MTNRQQLHCCDFLFVLPSFLECWHALLVCALGAALSCWDDVKYILILKVKARCAKPAVCDELLTCAPHSSQRKSLWQNLVWLSEDAVLAAGRKVDGEWMAFTTVGKHWGFMALGVHYCHTANLCTVVSGHHKARSVPVWSIWCCRCWSSTPVYRCCQLGGVHTSTTQKFSITRRATILSV